MLSNLSKHAFPGSNTSEGFFSLFDYIIKSDKAQRIICLKGGPGTGKSSLMKKIGKIFEDKNFDVEYFHCSSDSESLDSIVIPKIKVCLVDGTAPHIIDPKFPGIIDEIINLGTYLDDEELLKHKEEILCTSKEISNTFKRCYKYLKSARCIHDDWRFLNNSFIDLLKFNNLQNDLEKTIISPVKATCNLGYKRHLFATAFTPQGIITHINTLYKPYNNIYVLNGGPGTGKTSILKNISDKIYKKGYYVEIYHDPLTPSRIEHVLIPNLDLAILTSNEINRMSFVGQQIYMDNLLETSRLAANKEKIEEDKELFYKLIDKALSILNEEKLLHDELENYYVKNIDFTKVDKVVDNLIKRLLSYANCSNN